VDDKAVGDLGHLRDGADGSANLSVVIRTAVCTPSAVVIGTGGAITVDSVPAEEWEETELKVLALLRGYARTVTAGSSPTG
jgi:para-aminobenzoate synthetase